MKKIFATLAVSVLCASAWAQILDPGNGHYYQVVADPGVPWINAEQTALTMSYLGLQGHLATIADASENSFVLAAILADNLGEVYAGGYQNPVTEQNQYAGWTWVNNDGTFPGFNGGSTYTDWNPGEPNDAGGPGSEQWLGLNRGGGWNDEENLSLITGFVVEFDPTTDPTGGLVPDGGCTAALLGGALTLLGVASRRLRK